MRRIAHQSLFLPLGLVMLVCSCGDSDASDGTFTTVVSTDLGSEVIGTWRPSADMSDQFPSGRELLVLTEDGSISGVTACNNLFGSFTVVDGEFEIVELGATEQLCDEPLGDQQRAFEEPIRNGDASIVDGLLRFDLDGVGLVLERQ